MPHKETPKDAGRITACACPADRDLAWHLHQNHHGPAVALAACFAWYKKSHCNIFHIYMVVCLDSLIFIWIFHIHINIMKWMKY